MSKTLNAMALVVACAAFPAAADEDSELGKAITIQEIMLYYWQDGIRIRDLGDVALLMVATLPMDDPPTFQGKDWSEEEVAEFKWLQLVSGAIFYRLESAVMEIKEIPPSPFGEDHDRWFEAVYGKGALPGDGSHGGDKLAKSIVETYYVLTASEIVNMAESHEPAEISSNWPGLSYGPIRCAEILADQFIAGAFSFNQHQFTDDQRGCAPTPD